MKRYCVLFFLFNFVLYTAFSQRYEQTLRDGWMFARGEYPLAALRLTTCLFYHRSGFLSSLIF